MTVETSREHAFLRKLVGQWDRIADATGSNPEHGVWREIVRPIGDAWFVCEGHGEMPGGGSATTLLTLGCAAEAGRCVGTWIDSVIPHLWVYDGELDAAGRQLVLHTSGPDVEVPGRTAEYREVIAFQDDDNRSFTSHIRTQEGGWRVLMTWQYRRSR